MATSVTVTDRITAAITISLSTKKALIAAIREIEEADPLGFSDDHLQSLIDLVDTGIESHVAYHSGLKKLKRALETHQRTLAKLGSAA
jgi:hypothetical protein